MSYGKDDVINVATKLGRLVNGGVVGYYAGGKTSEMMSKTLPDQLISVVEKHKKIQLGASLAQSFIPGAGVAATAAAVASLWKMYYDINQVLGIKISENVGKSLTSAVLTNLGSFAAKGAATAVSEGAKFIPLVGWIASAGISTVTTTAIIYGSAYVYMNALSAMYSAKGKFDLDYLTSSISGEEDEEYEIEEYDTEDDDVEIEENRPVDWDTYRYFRRKVSIAHYAFQIVNTRSQGVVNYDEITKKVLEDTGITIADWQIKAQTLQEVCVKLKEFLNVKDREEINWHNIITTLPHGKTTDKFRMEVYQQGVLENNGDFLVGVVTSGTISVGDTIVLCTNDDEYYKAEVTWIEMFEKSFDEAEAGDTLGLGVDFKLNSSSGYVDVDCVLRYDELSNDDEEEEQSSSELTDSERKYINELKEILEDGEISPRERRLLEKIRVQLGISEERAAELEASLSSPQLTPEEQEYLNEYREIVAEGDISARDQRYLDKLKTANGISDQRAREIEKMI